MLRLADPPAVREPLFELARAPRVADVWLPFTTVAGILHFEAQDDVAEVPAVILEFFNNFALGLAHVLCMLRAGWAVVRV